MAKLSAHGAELDRREYPSYRVAVMTDGQILRNHGSGWKLWKRVKPGIQPAAVARKLREKYNARPPIFHEYVKILMDSCNLEHRGQLHMLVTLMPSDPDGVCVEFNDNNQYGGPQVDLDDCVKLCRLYESAMKTEVQETC